MRLPVFGGVAMTLLLGPVAWADQPAQSIMFEQPDEVKQLTTMPSEAAEDRGDRCTELARQMEELKGKPQRRYTVSQEYEAECQR